MDRGIAMQNRICYFRKQFFDDKYHKQLLQSLRPMVNDQEPQTQKLAFLKDKPHIYNKYDQYKFNEIDRENAHLADKIIEITTKPQNKKFIEYNELYSDKKNCFFLQSQRSLHKNYRDKEQVRIAQDNQRMLNRIKKKKSAYDKHEWNKSRLQNEQYIKNICLYQPKVMISQSINKEYWTQSQSTIHQFKSKQSQTDLQQFSKTIQKQMKLNKSKQSQSSQIIIYNQSKKFNNRMFIVKIFISKSEFNIHINCTKTIDKYQLQINEQEALKFLQEQYDNNIEIFVNQLIFNQNHFEIQGSNYKVDLIKQNIENQQRSQEKSYQDFQDLINEATNEDTLSKKQQQQQEEEEKEKDEEEEEEKEKDEEEEEEKEKDEEEEEEEKKEEQEEEEYRQDNDSDNENKIYQKSDFESKNNQLSNSKSDQNLQDQKQLQQLSKQASNNQQQKSELVSKSKSDKLQESQQVQQLQSDQNKQKTIQVLQSNQDSQEGQINIKPIDANSKGEDQIDQKILSQVDEKNIQKTQ